MAKEQENEKPGKNKFIFGYLQKVYKNLLGIRGTPHEIAAGFALGLFVGMSPSIGIQTPIAIFFAMLLKWNKISSAIGVWISNPFTAPFIYSLTYIIGIKILKVMNMFGNTKDPGNSAEMQTEGIYKMLLKAPEIFWALIMGGIVLGVPLSIAGYYFCFTAVEKYQHDLKQKLARRKQKRAMRKKDSVLKKKS